MSKQWGPTEVRAHLKKVFSHYGVLDKELTGFEMLNYLERYDSEVEEITQEQANAVSFAVIYALRTVTRARASEWN